MIGVDQHGAELCAAWQLRSAEVLAALWALDGEQLRQPTRLPGWDRLTIVCHLRYGAHALGRMTTDALEGTPTSYYPQGRAEQRPSTLQPGPGERDGDVIADLHAARAALVERWSALEPHEWSTPVLEPADNPDLGEVTLGGLVLAALTEHEVHGSDLDLGLANWSATFVSRALPARLGWLPRRRTNHRAFDRDLVHRWLLAPDDGGGWLVAVRGEEVSTEPVGGRVPADSVISGPPRDLLAMLLGRPHSDRLRSEPGDGIETFQRALPGP